MAQKRKKEKSLRPSLRESKRYLVFENAKSLDSKRKENIEKAILDYIGILGYAKASPIWISESNNPILAINREALQNIRASFAFAGIKIKRVSGTIKGLRL